MAIRGAGEGSIFQRGDGRWCAQVDLGWEAGKRKRKYVYGTTQAKVRRALTRATANRDQNIPSAPETLTVEQHLSQWLDSIERSVRERTHTSYTEIANTHLVPTLGKIRLAKLTSGQVGNLIQEKIQSGLSARRVQYIHAVLKMALRAAVEQELLFRNVAVAVKSPKLEEQEIHPLDDKELQRLFNHVRGSRWEGFAVLGAVLGLRVGEMLGLRWSDITGDRIRIRRNLQRLKAGFTLGKPKTKASIRTLTMPAIVKAALEAHRAVQTEERELAASAWKTPTVWIDGARVAVDDLVFRSIVGTPYSAPALNEQMMEVFSAAEISRHRVHDLRHTAATAMVREGVHPRTIQAIMGWSTIAMLNRYGHFDQAQSESAADTLNRHFAAI